MCVSKKVQKVHFIIIIYYSLYISKNLAKTVILKYKTTTRQYKMRLVTFAATVKRYKRYKRYIGASCIACDTKLRKGYAKVVRGVRRHAGGELVSPLCIACDTNRFGQHAMW